MIEIQIGLINRNTKRFDRNTKLIGWNCRHNWLIVSASFGAATITILHWHPPQFNLTGPRQIFEFEIEIVVWRQINIRTTKTTHLKILSPRLIGSCILTISCFLYFEFLKENTIFSRPLHCVRPWLTSMEISAKVFMKDIVGWQYFLRSENINSSQKRHTGEGKIVNYNVIGKSVSFKLRRKVKGNYCFICTNNSLR